MITIYTLGAIIIVSLLSFVGAFWFVLEKKVFQKVVFVLVSLSVGTLFGDAFFHLLPEAFEMGDGANISAAVVFGIIIFFVLEKFLHWHHDHKEGTPAEPSDSHPSTLGPMVLTADAVHNAIDGVLIGASFQVSVPVGIATTLAVILHELPTEMADMALLIHSGYSKLKAIFMNFVSALSAIAGGLVSLYAGSTTEAILPILLGFGAGSFIYIAGSDLLPELNKEKSLKKSLVQFIFIVIGFAAMYALLFIE